MRQHLKNLQVTSIMPHSLGNFVPISNVAISLPVSPLSTQSSQPGVAWGTSSLAFPVRGDLSAPQGRVNRGMPRLTSARQRRLHSKHGLTGTFSS